MDNALQFTVLPDSEPQVGNHVEVAFDDSGVKYCGRITEIDWPDTVAVLTLKLDRDEHGVLKTFS
jgi:hypothetical protein